MGKISVIVPVYKVEKYLTKCIESILAQTYTNFEIILVDDGSTDNSGIICDEYAQKDSRIKVIHKKNGGVSSARNEGILNAEGKYIAFVDADDWLNRNCFNRLIRSMYDTNVDLVSGSYDLITKEGAKSFVAKSKTYEKDEIAENLIDIYYLNGSVWGNLYKKEIIVNNNINFRQDFPVGEDTLFSTEYIKYCRKIVLVNDVVYNYNRIVNGSAIKKFYAKWDLYHITIFEAVKEIIEKSTTDVCKKQNLTSIYANRFCAISMYHYLSNSFLNEFVIAKLKNILEYYKEYLNISFFEKSQTNVISRSAFELFAKNDIEGFIRQWKKDLKTKGIYYKHYIKLLMKKLKLI